MAQITRCVSDDAHGISGTEGHISQCGHEKYRRQSSSHSSPRTFAAVSSPPAMNSDSSYSQESDVQGGIADAQRQIIQLQQEKKDALQKLKEICKMNSRWQKYEEERKVIVADLTLQAKQADHKIRELSEKVRCWETKLADQRNRIEELKLRWTDARVRAAELKSEVERTQRKHEAVKVTLKQSEKKRQEMAKKLEAAMKQGGAGCRGREEEENERRGRRDADKDRDLYHMSKRVVDLKERVDDLEKQVANHETEMDQQADLYTQQDSSLHQQYVSPDDISVEMVSMTSRNSRKNWNPWSRASYNVVGEASPNQKSVSVVNDDDDDDIERKIEEGSSMTRRRVPRWFFRPVLILTSLLVAAVLVTISVIPMVRLETTIATTTTTMTTINSTTTPTSILTEFPPITSTTPQPLPCVALQQTFNKLCERPSFSAQCEYVPQCQADGSRWASIQCKVDRRTCWCVDPDGGRTVPGTFTGVEGEIPDCL